MKSCYRNIMVSAILLFGSLQGCNNHREPTSIFRNAFGKSLPKGCQNLNIHLSGEGYEYVGSTVFVRMEIPSADSEKFLVALGAGAVLPDDVFSMPEELPGGKVLWWKPFDCDKRYSKVYGSAGLLVATVCDNVTYIYKSGPPP